MLIGGKDVVKSWGCRTGFAGASVAGVLLTFAVSGSAYGQTRVFMVPTDVVVAPGQTVVVQIWADDTGVTTTTTLQVTVADLPGNLLGSTNGSTIILDADAAGIGWFLDATPGASVEFDTPFNQYDLLTAAAHEVGHLLGYEHSEGDDVMAGTLSIGTRRLPALEPDPVSTLPADADPIFVFETFAPPTEDDDPEPIIAQPLYADGYTAIEDSTDDDGLKSTEETPIVFVPNDDDDFDPDALFADLDDSLLDELLAV